MLFRNEKLTSYFFSLKVVKKKYLDIFNILSHVFWL